MVIQKRKENQKPGRQDDCPADTTTQTAGSISAPAGLPSENSAGIPAGANASAGVGNQLEKQLRLIRDSQKYLLFFIAALFLSYYVTAVQEEQLLYLLAEASQPPGAAADPAGDGGGGNAEGACPGEKKAGPAWPDTCPPRIAAALLSFWALIYFFGVSGDTLRRCGPDPGVQLRNGVGFAAALLSLAAGGLRLWAVMDECAFSGIDQNAAGETQKEQGEQTD
ncbi:hypothetical protein [Bacilliculturomica massiliensis]|uniref:hypothetical protein n=1 Tax=Bacilliculturomica massiliensis TaxID=1917867 RepID=UPI00102FF125|nr:hypothetical protein [Bacilliculturomica massiliensis]